MGVAGAGKSTVMAELAGRLDWQTLEGDAIHTPGNVAKMAAGRPLTDEDRAPWLAAIAAWIGSGAEAGEPSIVTCSALRRRYRDVLSAAGGGGVIFVHLVAPAEVLATRMAGRAGHFMPPELLASQIELLEPLAGEPGFSVDATRPPAAIADEILERLGRARRRRTA
jgi:carbohydrate kinase (thermoresistant glucokinase family)